MTTTDTAEPQPLPASGGACPPWCFRHDLDDAGDEWHEGVTWRLRATGGRHEELATCAGRIRRPDGEVEGLVTLWVGIDSAVLTPAEAQALGLALLARSFEAEVTR